MMHHALRCIHLAALLALAGCSWKGAEVQPLVPVDAKVQVDAPDAADTDPDAPSDALDALTQDIGPAKADVAASADALPPAAADATSDVVADVAADAAPSQCCTDQSCPSNSICFEGKACVPWYLEGACWSDGNCPDTACTGAFVCPCNTDCPVATHPGVCGKPTDGCCVDDSQCAPGQFCYLVLQGFTCLWKPSPGHCWAGTNDCAAGQHCHGGAVCNVWGVSCDQADTQGDCVDNCKATDPNSFGTCGKMIGWVFDGKMCVQASGCDCGANCSEVFGSLSDCLTACAL